jgi:alkylated DNA nucleotide flippase Atl1
LAAASVSLVTAARFTHSIIEETPSEIKPRWHRVFEAEQGVRINPRNEQSLKNPR